VGAVDPLPSPAAPGAGEPNLSSAEDGVVLSWLEPAAGDAWSLKVARLAGGSWGPTRTVVTRDDLFVNWADFPSVTALSDGRLAAHWLQRGPAGGYDYGVRIAISDDDGVTWSEPWTPHEDATPTEHGFVSLTAHEGGALGVLWLDGRRYVEGPEGPATQEMTLRSRVLGADGEPGPEVPVDGRVCDCCQTSMAPTDDGWIAVYRDRSEDEMRDIYAALWSDGAWSEGHAVHRDGWTIDACPVNGPSVDARGQQVAVAWFTGAGDVPRAVVAFSRDGGAFFQEAVRVDGGDPVGRVDVVLEEDGSALATWIERMGEGAELRVRRVHADGAMGEPLVIARTSGARSAGFPRVVALGPGELLAAWTDVAGEASEVRVARVRVPTP
jgi:hypothetical protein